jgi:hypothetical protein
MVNIYENRLEVAKELLTKDGALIIAIMITKYFI